MVYKDFKGKMLSALGLGTMRLPVIDGKDENIDVEHTRRMIDYALKKGINYFDTAWGYHAGNSESVTGSCLKDHPRESFYIATKFPGYDVGNMGKAEEIFGTQLKRLQMDYVDFYLIHNVSEHNIDAYLDPQYHDVEYFVEQRKKGTIRHLGFSAHGDLNVMQRFLDRYGEYMEFCQIQLNYLDWELQSAKEKVELLKKYNLPVWVMEPLRGGMLTSLDEKRAGILKEAVPGRKQTEWAFRFIQSIPEVVMTLSGMSSFDQLEENIKIYETDEPLNEKERAALEAVADDIIASNSIPCTACRYCTTYCPMEIDIPKMIYARNEHVVTGGGFLPVFLVNSQPEGKKPSDCIACGSCMAVCPQQINIPEVLADLAQRILNTKF